VTTVWHSSLARSSTAPPRVSVCMPVYNGERFLRDAVACLAGQHFTDFEVVVVDDGSKDNSAVAAQEHIERHGLRGCVVSGPNHGAEQARDVACEHATGELIAQFDCDDAWEPDYLAAMVSPLAGDAEIGLVYCDFDETFEASGTVVRKSLVSPWIDRDAARVIAPGVLQYQRGVFFDLLLRGQVLFPPCTVYRRSVYDQAGGYAGVNGDLRISLDWFFGLRVSRLTSVAYVDRPLLRKSRHGGNVSANARLTAMCDVVVLDSVLADDTLTASQREHARSRASIRSLEVAYQDWLSGDARSARDWTTRSFRYRRTSRALQLFAKTLIPAPLAAWLRGRRAGR
jgi:glycosyltransferase involved in cell wall biosynthesis